MSAEPGRVASPSGTGGTAPEGEIVDFEAVCVACGHAAKFHHPMTPLRTCAATVYTDAPIGGGSCYPCRCRGFVAPDLPPVAVPGPASATCTCPHATPNEVSDVGFRCCNIGRCCCGGTERSGDPLPGPASVSPAEPPEILDACCGGRMWWWDKAHPLAVYMDSRVAPRGAVGALTGRPEWNPAWECAPDVLGDFRAMPFEDAAFNLIVFDPPHIVREKQPPEGINGLKYGALHPDTEQDDLRRGFAECWRVLAPGGTLVFKWAGALDRVEPHFPAAPTVGSRNAPRGSKGLGTRWFIFYKQLGESNAC